MEKERPRKEKKREIIKHVDDEEEEDLETSYMLIDVLVEHGINKNDIDKLKEAGYTTIESLSYGLKKAICELKGISEQKYEKIQKAVNDILGDKLCFVPSNKFLEKRKNLTFITTGSNELDNLLKGGIESYSLTELSGEFRTGKTQLCMTLCVTCQLPKKEGGGAGKALFIDTEGTFRPERLIPIAKRYNLDPQEVINNVYYARAMNHEHQYKLLVQASIIMAKMPFSLLIVDSATHLYRTEFNGRGELSNRQIHLAKFLRGCQKLADIYGIAVVITNQVVAVCDGAGFGGNDKKPIGGHIMAHAPQTRLALKKGAKDNRICKVIDSPLVQEAEAGYSINEDGIKDPNN